MRSRTYEDVSEIDKGVKILRSKLNMGKIAMYASFIGAAAWIPIIIKPICNYFRRVHIAPLDIRVLTDAFGVSANRKEKKIGTIILLALNIYIKESPLFAKNISSTVILKNGTKLKTELLDFSTLTSDNDDDTQSIFNIHMTQELNITRTIHPNVDNIKYVAFLVENANFKSPEEINKIKIRLGKNKWLGVKEATVLYDSFPKFNSTHMFDGCEKVIK